MNSKTSNKATADSLPPELATALAEAEAVLAKHDAFAAVMTETGHGIPASLASERALTARLGEAEISGEGADGLRSQLAAVKERRRADSRRRQSASDGLLEMAAELTQVRQEVTQAQAAFANTVILEFGRRWAEACRALAILRAEAAQLAAALRQPVATPAPYLPCLNVITGAPDLRPLTLADPIPEAALPPAVTALTGVFDRLDAAAALTGGIRQGVRLNEQHVALSRIRAGQPIEMNGVYMVTKAFTILGSDFPVNALVSRDLMSDGLLHRFWQGRNLRPLETAAAA